LVFNTQNSNKVALVTGGARRIGAAIVVQLHQEGYFVVVHCHQSQKEGRELVSRLNQQRLNSAHLVHADLYQLESLHLIIKAVITWRGQLDVLVNNASIFSRTDLTTINLALCDRLFRINVQAPLVLSTAAFSQLRINKGVIINLTDIHADRPLTGYGIYCQTKAALAMQTKVLACEFAPDVRVNAIAPGAIAWPEAANTLDDSQRAKIIAKTPLKCHGSPKFIAQAVCALANNSFITGQILAVDGGRSIN
jgi:pteridine reductase